jgi:hypothetical protein
MAPVFRAGSCPQPGSYDWDSGGKAGEATVSYERNASFSKTDPEWEKETDQMQFYVRGNVSVESDKVLVSLSRF